MRKSESGKKSRAPIHFEVMDDAMAEVYRAMTPAERLRIANGMFEFARCMISAQLQAAHPEWTADEVKRATAARLSNEATG